jgi:hypothetical protein
MSNLYYFLLDAFASDYGLFYGVFDSGNVYILLFLSGFLFPLLFWAIFYLLVNYPYTKIYHWIFLMLIILIAVFSTSYSQVNITIVGSNSQEFNDLLASDQEADNIANSLPIYFGLLNVLYAFISSSCYCFVLKRFSKIQMHLPF